MAVTIDDPKTEDALKRLAEAMGRPIEEAARIAAQDWLIDHVEKDALNEAERQRDLDRLLEQFRRWPIYDDRDHGDMLYDDHGLPK